MKNRHPAGSGQAGKSDPKLPAPQANALARLPMLEGIGPLLTGASDKRPTVGDNWPDHPGLSIAELEAAAPDCICWHIGGAPGHIAIDIDGPDAAAFCQSHSCDPYTADTWRITRTSNAERLKLVFTVTPEQKAALAEGAKTVKINGQELAVFAKHGTQIVVLGNHYTKESNFTENDDQYAWAGRDPIEAQPLPAEWFSLLTGVFCGDRPLRPPTKRQLSAPSSHKANGYSSSGGWSNSSERHPCPICGRDHSGACSISQDRDSVWCSHGETKSAPDCSKAGETVPGTDGRTWAYVRTEEHDSFGERSLFVLDKPVQPRRQFSLPAHQQQKLPASLQSMIQQLPDGWDEQGKARVLSAGRLAEMLEAQRFRFNELDLRAYVETSTGWQRITDADLDSAYVLLTGKGWKIGKDPVRDAILHVARQTSVHPVRDYLLRVKVDPSIAPYDLDQVAPMLFRASQPLHVAMVRKWLIGAAARALNPGCQMDYCLVLKGNQGLLKSTSLKALAGADWFTSTHAKDDKDFLLNVHSCWIYELAELDSITSRTKAGALKNLITTAADTFRPPYGRTSEKHKRQSVFCSTVNKEEFLRDDTGNRRFWVVPIEGTNKLDRDAITAARDGIWKAAVLAHESGELPMLSKEQEALSAAQNELFNEQEPWTEMVQAWMDGEPLHRWDPDRDPSTMRYDPDIPFTSVDVLYSAGMKRPDAITKADEMRVSAVLRGLGFERERNPVQSNGVRTRRWRLAAQPAQPAQPQVSEVVHPLPPSAATGLGHSAQPAQPFQRKQVVEEAPPAQEAPPACELQSGEEGCGGCADHPKPTAAQSISGAQPAVSEVVHSAEVVHPPNSSSKRPKPKPALRSAAGACPPELQQRLSELRRKHPNAHVATLVNLLDPDGSRRLSGRQIKRWLDAGVA